MKRILLIIKGEKMLNNNLDISINEEESIINSIELCELINKIRKEEGVNKKLLHKSLLNKINEELETRAKNFAGLYLDKQSKERPCYYLPPKEALQVIASESRKVRRRLIDEIERLTKSVRSNQPQKPLSTLELFELSLKATKEMQTRLKKTEIAIEDVKYTQNLQKKDINNLQTNISRLQTNKDYLTIIAFANIRKIKAGTFIPSVMGRRATKICKEQNMPMGKIIDPRFGEIRTYPVSVLEKVFENFKKVGRPRKKYRDRDLFYNC